MPDQAMYMARTTIQRTTMVTGNTLEEARRSAQHAACSIATLNPSDVVNVEVLPLSITELLHADNLRLWQEMQAIEIATVSQRDRWRAGALPADELNAIARDELFKPFDGFVKRRKFTVADIPHPRVGASWKCADNGNAHNIPITWVTVMKPTLTASQWSEVTRLRIASEDVRRHPWLAHDDGALQIQVRSHVGTCQRCHKSAEQAAALVLIAWAGRLLSREYEI